MENPKNVKRSIRIPKELHERLEKIAKERNKSVKVNLYGADESAFISYQYEEVSSP